MQCTRPTFAVKPLDHDLVDMSAIEDDRPLSGVYLGPHRAMDDFYALLKVEPLKSLSLTSSVHLYDLYTAIPAASSLSPRRNSFAKICQASTVSLTCLWTSLKSAYKLTVTSTIVGPNKLTPTHQLVSWLLDKRSLVLLYQPYEADAHNLL